MTTTTVPPNLAHRATVPHVGSTDDHSCVAPLGRAAVDWGDHQYVADLFGDHLADNTSRPATVRFVGAEDYADLFLGG